MTARATLLTNSPKTFIGQIDPNYYVDYYELLNHPDVKPFIPAIHVPIDHKAAEHNLTTLANMQNHDEGIYWGLYSSDHLIGTVGLHTWDKNKNTIEISYEIHPDYTGHGLATLACKYCVNFTVEHTNVDKILAYTLTDNVPSHRVAEKAGFTRTGILQNNCLYNGNLIDRLLFTYSCAGDDA